MAKLISLGLCHTLMGANMKGELNKKRPIVMYAIKNYYMGTQKKIRVSLEFQPKTY